MTFEEIKALAFLAQHIMTIATNTAEMQAANMNVTFVTYPVLLMESPIALKYVHDVETHANEHPTQRAIKDRNLFLSGTSIFITSPGL